jgi:hypothetical protein
MMETVYAPIALRAYLPLKTGGRRAQRAGWGSPLVHPFDPHPPALFKGRERAVPDREGENRP